MMTAAERETALQRMDEAIGRFYGTAVNIGCHPFVEFAGVMTAYVKSCRRAHENGVDFSACSRHTGMNLQIESVEIDYLVEKLACIFGDRIVVAEQTTPVGTPTNKR